MLIVDIIYGTTCSMTYNAWYSSRRLLGVRYWYSTMNSTHSRPCPLRWGSCGGYAAPWKAPGSSCAETCTQNWWQTSSTNAKTSSPSHTNGLSHTPHRPPWPRLCRPAPSAFPDQGHPSRGCQNAPASCALRAATQFHSKTTKWQANSYMTDKS